MQANDLIEFINKFKSIRNNFLGVFSITTIPNIKLDHYIIINTDTHYNPGKHWFCLIRRKKYFELFDSLGVTQDKLQYLNQFINYKNSITFKFNETVLQSNESISCGKFVLYFLCHRLHNLDLSLQELLDEIFESNLNYNENIVNKFYDEYVK